MGCVGWLNAPSRPTHEGAKTPGVLTEGGTTSEPVRLDALKQWAINGRHKAPVVGTMKTPPQMLFQFPRNVQTSPWKRAARGW